MSFKSVKVNSAESEIRYLTLAKIRLYNITFTSPQSSPRSNEITNDCFNRREEKGRASLRDCDPTIFAATLIWDDKCGPG